MCIIAIVVMWGGLNGYGLALVLEVRSNQIICPEMINRLNYVMKRMWTAAEMTAPTDWREECSGELITRFNKIAASDEWSDVLRKPHCFTLVHAIIKRMLQFRTLGFSFWDSYLGRNAFLRKKKTFHRIVLLVLHRKSKNSQLVIPN